MLNAGANIGQPETANRTPYGLLASRALAKGSLKGKIARLLLAYVGEPPMLHRLPFRSPVSGCFNARAGNQPPALRSGVAKLKPVKCVWAQRFW